MRDRLRATGHAHVEVFGERLHLWVPEAADEAAARQTLASDTPMLKPMYTPGFASPEHYKQRELLGPWSDIYSVGASMYASLAATAPQSADSRQEKDKVIPAMVRWQGQYSEQLLTTVDWCLSLDHLSRPQSVFALQKALTKKVPKPELRKKHWLDHVVGKFKRKIEVQ